MSTTYNGADAYPTSLTIPADGDPKPAASVNVAIEGLADRTTNLKGRVISLETDVGNLKAVVNFGTIACDSEPTGWGRVTPVGEIFNPLDHDVADYWWPTSNLAALNFEAPFIDVDDLVLVTLTCMVKAEETHGDDFFPEVAIGYSVNNGTSYAPIDGASVKLPVQNSSSYGTYPLTVSGILRKPYHAGTSNLYIAVVGTANHSTRSTITLSGGGSLVYSILRGRA